MLGPLGDDDAVDQHARHLDLARVERAALGDALDLGDDDAAAVVRGHGDRQRLERQRLTFHGQVAVAVAGGRADDPDLDRERLVEEHLLAVDLEQADQILVRRRIDLAAAVARVDEGAQADPAQRSRLAGGDVAEQVRDHSLRQVVGLDVAVDREHLELGHQAPVAADDALEKAVMAEVVQAARLAVALPGGVDQGQRARRAAAGLGLGGKEALLEREGDAFGKADADEAAGRDGVAVVDQAHRLRGADDLVARRGVRPGGVGRVKLHEVKRIGAGRLRSPTVPCRAAEC